MPDNPAAPLPIIGRTELRLERIAQSRAAVAHVGKRVGDLVCGDVLVSGLVVCDVHDRGAETVDVLTYGAEISGARPDLRWRTWERAERCVTLARAVPAPDPDSFDCAVRELSYQMGDGRSPSPRKLEQYAEVIRSLLEIVCGQNRGN